MGRWQFRAGSQSARIYTYNARTAYTYVLYLGFIPRTRVRIYLVRIGRSFMSDTSPRLITMMVRKPVRRKCVREILAMKSRMGFHGTGSRCIVLLVEAGGGTARGGRDGRCAAALAPAHACAIRVR